MSHTFHIPVLGLGYSIDTPLKVARYGISSVVSIVDDSLAERMRRFHTPGEETFIPINNTEESCRSKRITAYLNLLNRLVDDQHQNLKNQSFTPDSEISRYFELLPDHCAEKQLYLNMQYGSDDEEKVLLQEQLRGLLKKGSIDANIMSKVDKMNYSINGEEQLSDALASLKGFAESDLSSSLVLSAGMNPRLYSYIEEFPDFFPSGSKAAKKKIILKVSDYRSAFIQAKFLAKKGIWVSEFRIESGLNCGGHAFATEGYLIGPILEEFKQKRSDMISELYTGYLAGLNARGIPANKMPDTRITVQGGIGTSEENEFLLRYYQLDGTGWGSPFLLVPEATNVDDNTLTQLISATEEDFYVSNASPLGILFNNFRKSTAEKQRIERIEKGRPGSPCTKKYLVTNTEFADSPICVASREYQHLKLQQLQAMDLGRDEYQQQFEAITEKICLCEGLCSSVYLKNNLLKPRENGAVTICPGPNTAYFKGIYSLDDMVNHIYGKVNLLKGVNRPFMFAKEISLYIDYLKTDIEKNLRTLSDRKAGQLEKFRSQLLEGIEYYTGLLPALPDMGRFLKSELEKFKTVIAEIEVPKTAAR